MPLNFSYYNNQPYSQSQIHKIVSIVICVTYSLLSDISILLIGSEHDSLVFGASDAIRSKDIVLISKKVDSEAMGGIVVLCYALTSC